MRRWLLIIVGGLVTLVAAVYLVGAMLPREHVASRTAQLTVPPDSVWAAITDVEAFPSWRPGLTRVERLPAADGRLVWREHGEFGPMTFEQADQDPPRRLVTRIVDEDLGFGGTWTYTLEPSERGSRITITEEGFVDSPLFRFMSRFVFGHGATMEAQLRALGARFGESVELRDGE